MSRGEIMAIEAGRELDILVAKEVFGLIFKENRNMVTGWEVNGRANELERYSKDMSAAWKVIEKMQSLGWAYNVNFVQNHYYPQGIQHCCISRPKAHISAEDVPYIDQSEKIFFHGHCDTAPGAICKAALLASTQ